MTKINLNKIPSIMKNIETKGVKFEIDPLDLGLADIQRKLQKREGHIADYGSFAPVVERFESKDPSLNVSEIKVSCTNIENNIHKLEISVLDRARINEYVFKIKEGAKQEILTLIKDNNFFDICKKIVLCVDENASLRKGL